MIARRSLKNSSTIAGVHVHGNSLVNSRNRCTIRIRPSIVSWLEVAAQLLIAPPLEHLLDGLRLGMQQRDRAHDVDATALIDRHRSLRQLSHRMNH